jgi:hypothetical protein
MSAEGLFSWTPTYEQAGVYDAVVAGLSDAQTMVTDTVQITVVDVPQLSISGVVKYNVSGHPIEGATVSLMDGATVVDTYVTGADGAYSFSGYADDLAGSYTLTVSKTTGWGGSLASDALEVALSTVYPDSNFVDTDLQKVAGDVVLPNDPAAPDIGDALRILQKSVDPNDVTYPGYDIDDWQFESHDITVTTADVAQDIQGIAAGDARSDYDPTGALAKSGLLAISNDMLKVNRTQPIKYELKLDRGDYIGSLTMSMVFPANKLIVESVEVVGKGTLLHAIDKDVISIAWADFTGKNAMRVEDGGTFAVITFKPTDSFAKNEVIEMQLLKGEITNKYARRLDKSIIMPAIVASVPMQYDLAQNYPNPFNPSTTIQYDLPENGNVNLAIYNTLGEQVASLVDTRQEAGSYEINWNAANLASGVYFYRLYVEGVKGFVMTKKMILMK